jgi:hypothetical protein
MVTEWQCYGMNDSMSVLRASSMQPGKPGFFFLASEFLSPTSYSQYVSRAFFLIDTFWQPFDISK